eukprot:3247842-Pyramimonas_sp.AAC.1
MRWASHASRRRLWPSRKRSYSALRRLQFSQRCMLRACAQHPRPRISSSARARRLTSMLAPEWRGWYGVIFPAPTSAAATWTASESQVGERPQLRRVASVSELSEEQAQAAQVARVQCRQPSSQRFVLLGLPSSSDCARGLQLPTVARGGRARSHFRAASKEEGRE